MITMRQDLSEKEMEQRALDLKNKRTGLAIFQVSWIMVFICLSIVNWQLRFSSESWPPPGVEKLGALVPTGLTLALVASSIMARRATQAVKAGDVARFLRNWRIAGGLGIIFLVVMAVEWLAVPVSGQYSNIFRVMVGFHAVHALAIGVVMWVIYRSGRAGVYDANNFWPVEGTASLWHFVTIAWMIFYFVLYWL